MQTWFKSLLSTCPSRIWEKVKVPEWTLVVPDMYTAQKMKFSIKGFFSKCEQIRSFLDSDNIWRIFEAKFMMSC